MQKNNLTLGSLFDGSGGFSDTLIELAGVLPYRAYFLWEA